MAMRTATSPNNLTYAALAGVVATSGAQGMVQYFSSSAMIGDVDEGLYLDVTTGAMAPYTALTGTPLGNWTAVMLNDWDARQFSTRVGNNSSTSYYAPAVSSDLKLSINGVLGYGIGARKESGYVGQYAAGELIGGSQSFGWGTLGKAWYFNGGPYHANSYYGPWGLNDVGYMGVALNLGGQVHYGWVQVRIEGAYTATVLGMAYEDQPGVPILTGAIPEPASATALLALGASGFALWRRRQTDQRQRA